MLKSSRQEKGKEECGEKFQRHWGWGNAVIAVKEDQVRK